MTNYPAITIKALKKECDKAIKEGFGDKKIMISADDEGNGFHGLFYGFMTDVKDIELMEEQGLLCDDVDPNELVLLG